VANFPNYKVVVTGHSLGGAVGTFAAAELRNEGINVDLVCFLSSLRIFLDGTNANRSHSVPPALAIQQPHLLSHPKPSAQTTESLT
jgi:thioesterase domain-containing protein